MKKYLLISVVIGLVAGACAPESTQTAIIPLKTEILTSTPTVISSPTVTPTIATPSFTANPTIPTITPTFDVSSIITVTPAPKQKCIRINPDLKFTYIVRDLGESTLDQETPKAILDFMNQGGSADAINIKMKKTKKYF